MKLLDILITIVCGEALALLAADFLKEYEGVFEVAKWTFLFLFPVLSIIVFWLVDLISKKLPFALQLAKYFLVGVIATLIDLKVYGLLTWFFGLELVMIIGVSKGISFLISVLVKFVGNKYWAFEETKKEGIKEEFSKFLIVTFIGLLIDLSCFFYFSRILGPQFGISPEVWVKISVILAAVVAAAWNFLSYKFIVFKKQDASPLS